MILAATLSAHPAIPAIGLVLVLSVDWFIGIARALGNWSATAWPPWWWPHGKKDIDRERAHAVLDGRVPAGELDEGLSPRCPPGPRRRCRYRGRALALESRHSPTRAALRQRIAMPEHIDPDMTAEAIAEDIVAAIVSPAARHQAAQEALASVYRVSRTKVRAALLMLSRTR